MTASIHTRILFSALLVLVLFLGLTGTVLDNAFRYNLENAQREHLRTQIYTLLATAELGENNQLTLPDEITEPRLNIAESTLHARVISADGQTMWQSKSMLNTHINFPSRVKVGEFIFTTTSNQQATYTTLSFATLWVTERGEQQYIFQVAENQKVLQKQISNFRHNLWTWLVGVSLVLLLVQGMILRWGLKPLRHVAEDLLLIEKGESQHLSGHYPREITPLTSNLNQLLDSAQQQLGRYRDALGNMAHSLKTPIAVLRGIIESSSIEQKATADEQLQTINNIVEYQLQRAATAGQRGAHSLTELAPVVEKINNSLQKVFHDRHIEVSIDIPAGLAVKVDEGDLYEMLGNLFENAYKWSNSRIRFSAYSDNRQLKLLIEDDGPGINKEQRERILLRGQRADQNTPGHGLGMAMVSEIILLYEGHLEISASDLGGTKISITL